MIPFVVAPLTGLTVLVTRPALQAAALCARIESLGGTAIAFPAIEIERIQAAPAREHDLVVFVSVHAVAHGVHLVQPREGMRVAAIGAATAAALAAAGLPADIVPVAAANSETLLEHPALAAGAISRVLIVRGEGGRELLQASLSQRGMAVEALEVYRRVKPVIEADRVAAIERQWIEAGIDVVTITSVENLRLLLELLSATGRDLLRTTPIVVASHRIGGAVREAGLTGGTIVAPGADDESMIGALARWHTRDRAN